MILTEVAVPPEVDLGRCEQVVESACAAEGLRVARKATLATYPGSIHWHVKRGNESGTLEITVWPEGRRVWLKVQAGRAAPWIEVATARLKARLEEDLGFDRISTLRRAEPSDL